MLKDLRLACKAAVRSGVDVGLGAAASTLYEKFAESGDKRARLSAIKLVRERSDAASTEKRAPIGSAAG